MLTMEELVIGIIGILGIFLISFIYATLNERNDTDMPKKKNKKK